MLRSAIPTVLIAIILMLGLQTATAQVGSLTRYEFHAGFYGGPSQYIGAYNPWWFGSSYTYGENLQTNADFLTGELNYGGYLSLRLRPRIFLRFNAEFGNLRYQDDALNYHMSTPYSTTSFNMEFKGNPDGRFKPYMTIGYGSISFTSPMPNLHPEFSKHSPNQLGERKVAAIYPVSFGFQYHITDRTAIFSEAGFNFTSTNELDNFTPPEADFSLSNDAFMSLRFGISMEILRRSNLKFRQASFDEALFVDVSEYFPILEVIDPEIIQPVPVDELIAERNRQQQELALAEQREREAREAEERRLREAEERQQREAERAAQRAAERQREPTPVIRVVEPEESRFEPEAALEELEEIMEDRRRRAELGEIDLSDWDPEIPIVLTTPRPIPGSLLDETGIVTEWPPRGYYVQVYASIGPISATNARDMTINALSRILEDPERQVIITMRQQFYEVRIGVFDSYDDTIAVLREIQGTFIDSYTLIFVPRD